jgi:hypothetical protein
MIGPPGRPVETERARVPRVGGEFADALPCPTHRGAVVSKKTKKRKLNARRKKANHGKRPNAGRR